MCHTAIKARNDVHEANGSELVTRTCGNPLQECAAREILEETGLRAAEVLKGIITFTQI